MITIVLGYIYVKCNVFSLLILSFKKYYPPFYTKVWCIKYLAMSVQLHVYTYRKSWFPPYCIWVVFPAESWFCWSSTQLVLKPGCWCTIWLISHNALSRPEVNSTQNNNIKASMFFYYNLLVLVFLYHDFNNIYINSWWWTEIWHYTAVRIENF